MIVDDLFIGKLALDLILDGLKGLLRVDCNEVYGSTHWPTDEFYYSTALMGNTIGEEVDLLRSEL